MDTKDKLQTERNRARVLVIDDEIALARAMARMLAGEHEVTVVTSAQDALDRIAEGERFDLILCDLMMPGVTGMDFLERLPSIAAELVERVAFVTGGAYTPRAEAFLARAALPPITKPFLLAEFRHAVRDRLRRRGHR